VYKQNEILKHKFYLQK